MPCSNVVGEQQAKIDSVTVIAPVNMEISGHTIQLIQGERKEEYSSFCEELLELMSSALSQICALQRD